jgi:hypothetical protein
MDWRDFQAEIEGLTGDERSERARRVIASHQGSIADDPPSWLLEAAGSRALAEGELETEDLEGVEVLAIGGPIKAVGSPPGGEHITKSRLAQIVADTRELMDLGELRGPVKLGHSQMQTLLRESGLTDGELPAAGWIENVRLNAEGTRAVADLKKVPKKLAQLVRAHAYRTRSAELKRVLSQANGRTYEMVIGGLALMGAKAPAIRTLDDFVKLYADENEVGDTIAFAEHEASEEENPTPADTRAQMAEKTEEQKTETQGTDDFVRVLGEALGLEGDDLNPEKVAETVAGLKEKAEATPEEKRELEESELARSFEEYKESAEEAQAELKTQIETVQEERRLEQRAAFVESLVRDGKIPPADKDAREKWEGRFDKDAEMARSFAEDLPVAEDLTREFGAEGEDEVDDDGKTKADREYEEDAEARLGLSKEALI